MRLAKWPGGNLGAFFCWKTLLNKPENFSGIKMEKVFEKYFEKVNLKVFGCYEGSNNDVTWLHFTHFTSLKLLFSICAFFL